MSFLWSLINSSKHLPGDLLKAFHNLLKIPLLDNINFRTVIFETAKDINSSEITGDVAYCPSRT